MTEGFRTDDASYSRTDGGLPVLGLRNYGSKGDLRLTAPRCRKCLGTRRTFASCSDVYGVSTDRRRVGVGFRICIFHGE